MIKIRDVSKWYADFQVLKTCSVSIARGEVIVVCGPSGSGKSTLIKCVNGLEPFNEGEIVVDGLKVADKVDLRVLRTRIGMVFQNFELYPHLSALDNICLAPMVVLKRKRAELLPGIAPGYLRTDVVDATGLEGGWDFSFSGLKTAVLRETKSYQSKGRSLPVFGFTRGDTSIKRTLEIRWRSPPSISAIMICGKLSTVSVNSMCLPSGVNSGVWTNVDTGLEKT